MPVTTYDEVFQAQAHYRELLDAMARPGTINTFAAVGIDVPGGLPRGSTYVGWTLLSPAASFALIGYDAAALDYLRINTGGVVTEPENADFLFAPADMATLALRIAKTGTLQSPESSATLIVSVEALSREPLAKSVQLRMSGPGIETENALYIGGIAPELFEDRSRANVEYPLGTDLIFTCEPLHQRWSQVACLPRTTEIRWER